MGYKIKYFQCGNETPKSEYPLGLGYLKAFVGGEIVKDKKDLVDCDFIGISSTDAGARDAWDILNATSIPVLIGGQITQWPKISDYHWIVIKGEGELPLKHFLETGEVIERVAHDIDTLPFPERGRCNKVVPFLTSRGCPYRCNFCSSSTFWGRARFHSAEYVLSELDYIKKTYPRASYVYPVDDLFFGNKKRFRKIFEGWMRKGFTWNINGFARSNLFDEEMAVMCKQMGVTEIRFGAESGSNRVLKLINKKATVEDHQRCIDICHKHGLNVSMSLMHGIPGETEEDRILTGKFTKRNPRVKIRGHYKFKPFTGTKYYDGRDLMEADMEVR